MADYINKIRTTEGDKPVNYEALANKPNSLPNPNKIKFTGSVVAEYDGSSEVTVNIPNGASEEQAAQIQTNTNDISELKNKTSELKGDIADVDNRTIPYSNLFNKNDVENGYRWNATSSGLNKISVDGFSILNNPIKLMANTIYYAKGFFGDMNWTPFYNIDGTYDKTQSLVNIEKLTGQWHSKWTVGDKDCLINVSVDNAFLDNAYISEIYDEYKPYREVDYSLLSKKLTDDVSNINEELDNVIPKFSNLFNKNDVENGYRWNATSSGLNKISVDGFSILNNPIKLMANTIYYAKGFFGGMNWTPFYNIDGTYDKTQSLATMETLGGSYHSKIIVGDSDCYINATLVNSEVNNAYMSQYYDFYTDYGITDYSPYCNVLDGRVTALENSNISETMCGKKVLIIGDSISSDTYYHTKGSKMWVDVLREENFFNEETLNNNSVHATGFKSMLSNDPNSTFINRLQAVENPLDYDIVITIGGVNDGKNPDFSIDDIKTAMNDYFSYLTSTFLNARLLVISPTYGFANYDINTNEVEVFEALKGYAKTYRLPVLNATDESGWNPKNDAQMEMYSLTIDGTTSPDRLHPNEDFHRKFYAPFIKGFLKRFI